jgi:hypothetical protein
MTDFSTNISDYSIEELMAILEIQDIDKTTIIEITNKYYEKYKRQDPNMAVFFKQIQSQLLQYADGLSQDNTPDLYNKIEVKIDEGFVNFNNNNNKEAIYPIGEKQITDWYENENLSQKDENQTNKITDRQQKIGFFGNEHMPMKREQIATTDTFQLPIKQDSLNPNLKNTITRSVNIDSQFRQYTNGIDSGATDYTFDLSDTLKDTLSIRLYSYQIPYTWYTIDSAYGNTCLWIIDGENTIAISVSPGNYNTTDFVNTLNIAFTTAGFINLIDPSANFIEYNANNGIITMNLYNSSYIENNITIFTCSTSTIIMFYDFTGILVCNNNCFSKSNNYFNNSLGWLMGYRIPYINVIINGNQAPAILNLTGTKYLILVVDDYNQNHVNNSLVSISQYSNTLKIPSYYSPDLPSTCIKPSQTSNNLSNIITEVTTQSIFDLQNTNPLNGLLIAGKYENNYTSTQVVLPSAPRTLTQSQIYTINQINSNRNNLTDFLAKAPTSSDILATIPIKTSGQSTGSLLVEFSGSLQDNIRTYFGPINIERMAVKLLDDKGNVINLNGNDWCVTFICECLYQY